MDDTELPLTEHLAELRRRIVWILLAWGAAAVLCWRFREAIFGALLEPALNALGPDTSLQAIAPTEIFFTYMKCALLAGFVLSTPVFFWNVWAFIAPGLYANEKRFAIPFVIASTLLFVGGASFGYGLVFPLIFNFFSGFANELVSSAWTMREVFGLTTRLFIAFGVGFELPVIVFFVAASGLLTTGQLLSGSKYGLLAAFTLGAVLTPPDIVSQVLLAAPLFVLYLIGAIAGGFFARTSGAKQPPQALP